MTKNNKIQNLFLSVGAMKAGTTWVYDKLQHHPQTSFSLEKEIYYFSHVNGAGDSLSLDKLKRRTNQALMKAGRQLNNKEISFSEYKETLSWYMHYLTTEPDDQWYKNLFPTQDILNKDVYCADFSNLNCFLDDSGWQHVRSISDKLKVIYILRDPVARLWSHYKFHLQFTSHKDLSRPEENRALFKGLIEKPWFNRNSMYSENIRNMRANLKPEEFRVFYLEDISEDPFTFFDEIHSFLEIENFDYSFLDIKERKNTSLQRDIPEDWYEDIRELLLEEQNTLKNMGLFHSKWLEL